MDWLTFWTVVVQVAIFACLLIVLGVVAAAAVQAARGRTPDGSSEGGARSGGPR